MLDLFSITTLILSCLCLGAVAGFLGGLLGIGGGVIMVPGLLIMFDILGLFGPQATLFALGTSLAVIVFTSLSAARVQISAGKVLWPIIRSWTVWLILGGLTASVIAVALPGATLKALIGVFLLVVAAIMLGNWSPAASRQLPGVAGSAALGLGAGIISGLAGIGGGNVIVPTLVYYNVPMHNATATSSTFGVPVALAAALGYAMQGEISSSQIGYIYLPAMLSLLAASVLCAPLGVRFAHRTDPALLKRWFGSLLVVVAARMLYTAWV